MSDRRYPYDALDRLLTPRLACTTEQPDGGVHGRPGSSSALQAELLGVWPEQIRRWRQSGLTRTMAERLAEAAGYVPYEVWPELLDETIAAMERECAAEDCTSRFIPPAKAPNKRFCSTTCKARTLRRRRYQTDLVFRDRTKASWRRYYSETRDWQVARSRRNRAEAARRKAS